MMTFLRRGPVAAVAHERRLPGGLSRECYVATVSLSCARGRLGDNCGYQGQR